MAKFDGRLIALLIEDVKLVGRTTSSINMSADMLDATTADSAGYKEYIPGEKGATISVAGLYDPAAVEGVSESVAYLKGGTQLTVKWGGTEPGDTYWYAEAFISSVSITGDKNTVAGYSLEIQITGEWTEATVSAGS